MNIVIDDLMTNYQLGGKGRLVLLLHGWGDSSKGLEGLASALAQDYKVLGVDLPGFGGTQAPKEAWDLDNYSDFLGKLLKKLELNELFAVVGHSNGGALAIRSTSLGQIKPKKLVLLAASGVRDGGGIKRIILNVVAKTGNIATIWMPERYRQALRKSLYSTAGSDMMVAPQLEETFKKTVRQDVQADAAKINIPTLLIYGANDKAVPVSQAEVYANLIKDSELQLLPATGHFVHHEQSEKVISMVEEFLK